jgi:hypothetical protein
MYSSARDNVVYQNNFYRRSPSPLEIPSVNAEDWTSGNQWYNDVTKKGNYWDDYYGLGIRPYDKIERSDSMDPYPLSKPVGKSVRALDSVIKSNIRPLARILDRFPLLAQIIEPLLPKLKELL